jgi:hypothetical protein
MPPIGPGLVQNGDYCLGRKTSFPLVWLNPAGTLTPSSGIPGMRHGSFFHFSVLCSPSFSYTLFYFDFSYISFFILRCQSLSLSFFHSVLSQSSFFHSFLSFFSLFLQFISYLQASQSILQCSVISQLIRSFFYLLFLQFISYLQSFCRSILQCSSFLS